MLPDADVAALMRFVTDVGALASVDDFVGTVLEAVPLLIRCQEVAWNEVDLTTPSVVWQTNPAPTWADHARVTFARHAAEHPLISYYERTGDGRPKLISDFLSPEDFHNTALYQEIYSRLGVEDQMACVLPSAGPSIIGVALNRDRRDFTRRDRTILNFARPYLVTAYGNARAYTHLRRMLDDPDPDDGLHDAYMIFDKSGAPTFESSGTREMLLRWPSASGAIAALLTARTARSSPPTPEFLTERGSILELRLLPGGVDDNDVVLLTAGQRPNHQASLARLGLTARQAEVLGLLATGHSNAEIAAACSISTATVKKHLEGIYDRLGVQSRAGATHVALIAGEETSRWRPRHDANM